MSQDKETGSANGGNASSEAPQDSAKASQGAVISRRSLLLGVGGIAALMGLGCLRFTPHKAIVRPPGGQDEVTLIASCIRCERCVEICPRSVIKLSHIEDGILSMRTPEMNFYRDYCDFCAEDNGGVPLCVATCPTEALHLPENSTAENTIIGKAEIIEDWCLAYYDTGCHVCYDACPYDAIELDDHHRPYIVEDKCNGCGACEAVCVSLTNGSRAIAAEATSRAIRVIAQQA